MMQLWGMLLIAGLVQDCAGAAVFNPRTDKFQSSFADLSNTFPNSLVQSPRPRRMSEEEEYCYSQDPHPYHLVASKTSYTFARDHNITHSNLVPEGCNAQQLWHLVRHGTRYPGDSDIEIFLSRLPDLQAQVIQAHQSDQGELCSGDVSLLAEWDIGSLNTSWNNQLAEAGVMEVRDLASRYQAALPSLLDHPFSNDSYTFRYTATDRTKDSAQAYAEGVFGPSAPVYFPPAHDPDPLLKFYEVCPKYVQEVDENPEAVEERNLFIQGPEVAEVVTRVSQHLGVPLDYGDVELLYDACRYYQAWSPDVPSAWCAAFTSADLVVMEYIEDLHHYYTAGYGYPINYQMACPPLSDVFSHFRNVVEEGNSDPKGVFYFTHSKALLTVMSRLGLYRDAQPLTHSEVDPERQWRTSLHSPFATNLAFTLSSCPSKQWWVSVVEGERVVQVNGCESTLGCTWEEFVHVFTPFLDCDLASICQVDEGGTDPQDESTFITSAAPVVKVG